MVAQRNASLAAFDALWFRHSFAHSDLSLSGRCLPLTITRHSESRIVSAGASDASDKFFAMV